MAVVVKVPLERLADPTDITYIPRPDWYFLFLFQILKLFEGPLEVVGSVVLPTGAIFALLLVPFVDRGVAKRLAQRTVAFSAVALAAIGWTGLTVTAIVTTPAPAIGAAESGAVVEAWQQLSPEALAGIGYYRKEQCGSCHNLTDGKTKVGPNLSTTPIKRSVGWMVEHFKNPAQMVPGTSMPPIHLNDAQLSTLAAFLLRLTPANALDLESAPAAVVEGAMIYQQQQCGMCHIVNGVGVQLGPALNGVAGRRTRAWMEVQIRNPKRHSPETMMPACDLSSRDMEVVLEYLTAMPPK
jgi:ubiquinol-cytochrome c reductase cytochrome b subunit